MATLGEIRDAVVKKTRRLDQGKDILKDVIRAVRYFHGLEKFDKDLTYAELNPEYTQNGGGEFTVAAPTDLKVPQGIIPRFTDFPHVSNIPTELKLVSSEDLFKLRRMGRRAYDNTYFFFGDDIRGYCSAMPIRLDISYWKKPILEDENSKTWITEDFENVIFHSVCAVNYGDNGYREKAQEHQLRADMESRNLLASARKT